ncbi:hypothetical protein AgCh_033993 [Apium graveolens]
MTGDRALLSNMVEKAGPVVTFGDNSKGLTEGYGCLQAENVIIENVYIVQGLKHNLLSISQFCDKGYYVSFDKLKCQILHKKNEKPSLMGIRKGNFFVADMNSDSSDEFNKDGDLRTSIAPPVTSLRMTKVIFLAGTAEFWSYERSDTLVRMSVNMSGKKSETHGEKQERYELLNRKCGCTKEAADNYFKTEKYYLAEI